MVQTSRTLARAAPGYLGQAAGGLVGGLASWEHCRDDHIGMSSLKISRLFVGLSDQGLRYGLRHGFRHGGVNSIAKRTLYRATQVSYSKYRWLFLSYKHI